MLLLLSLAVMVTLSDALSCGEEVCVHRHLSSHENEAKTVKDVFGAAWILSLTLESDDEGKCDAANYGYEQTEPTMWVDKGCKGSFKVCYVPGKCERWSLSTATRPSVTLQGSCTIHAMKCINQHTDVDCQPDKNYSFHGNVAKVFGGCDCDFVLCHALMDEDYEDNHRSKNDGDDGEVEDHDTDDYQAPPKSKGGIAGNSKMINAGGHYHV